jgi:HlyD family secretion protein
MAESMLTYQDRRLQRHREREDMLRLQVEHCTIRAPHDGFVIYANNDDRQIKIEEGMVVRQRQDLFYLPNLSKMMAMALVHESVASRIQPGMLARVRIEGLPGRVLEGHVNSVAQLPTQNYFNEVRYFYTEILLDTIPRGLRPGMTAEVEIATERREDVLAIPIEALAVENGQDFCYVAHEDRVERREIEIGRSTSNLLEVTEGLEEGELVVLDPDQFDDALETLSPFDPNFHSLAAETQAP